MIKMFKFAIKFDNDGMMIGTLTTKEISWDSDMYSQLCWAYRDRVDLMMVDYMSIMEKMIREPYWEPDIASGGLILLVNTCTIYSDPVKTLKPLLVRFAPMDEVDNLRYIQEGCNIQLFLDKNVGGKYYPCTVKVSMFPYIHNKEVPIFMQSYLPGLNEICQEITRSMLYLLIPDGSEDENEHGTHRPMNPADRI